MYQNTLYEILHSMMVHFKEKSYKMQLIAQERETWLWVCLVTTKHMKLSTIIVDLNSAA
jgi:hypothetical protein